MAIKDFITETEKCYRVGKVPAKSWVRYRQEDWIFKSAAANADGQGKKYNMIDVGLVKKIENK